MNKISSFLYVNCITFVAIVFITFINGETYNLVGNLIWLPLGTVLLCYLLFGFRIVIAVFLAIMFSAHWFHEEPLFIFNKNMVHLVGTLAPLLAIASMKFFKLSNFFEGGKLVFQHLLFLVILTALYNTLMKFFVFSYFDNLSINAVKFIQGYLLGDILGCLAVLFFAVLVVVPGIRYFAPELVPSDLDN
ncbi:MAG: hypothetical protein ABGY11_07835 [Candidatus Thioglobus sp.]